MNVQILTPLFLQIEKYRSLENMCDSTESLPREMSDGASSHAWEGPSDVEENIPELELPKAGQGPEEMIDSLVQPKFWWSEKVQRESCDTIGNYRKTWQEQIEIPKDGKYAGDSLPYHLASDDYVGSGLLICLFVSVLIVARSLHYLMLSVKDFFSARQRENLFNDIADGRMQGKHFFVFVVCFSLGVLLFDFQQNNMGDSIAGLSPYFLLGFNTTSCLLAYLARTTLYMVVNGVFFERDQREKWMESYHLLSVFSGLLLLSIALLVAFYDLDFSKWSIYFLISVFLAEFVLIFKTYRIFFEGLLGFLHLILYLCTLEFLPLLATWKGLVWVTEELTKLV